MTDVDDKLERFSERFRLRFWHQIGTLALVVGMPVVGFLLNDNVSRVRNDIADLRSESRKVTESLAQQDKNIAVLQRSDSDQDRRLASIEDWRGSFSGYGGAPASNYRKN